MPPGTVNKSMTGGGGGGGGGYGDPRERDPRQLQEDLLDGFISPEHASTVYGVSAEASGR